VLESEYVLDIHHYSLLYKPCWPSKPFTCARVNHTSERESAQLLIRSILVLLFSFKVPLKNIKKMLQQKEEKKQKKEKKQATTKKGVCVFFFFLSWCFVITFVSRLTSLAQSSRGLA
jgi:hypothetical protein